MKLSIHPAAFLFGALLVCTAWLSLRTVPPSPFVGSQSSVARTQRVRHQEVAVDATTLRRYTGEYRSADGTSVFIALEGEHLFALVPNAPRLELLPFSVTAFFLKELDAEVEFDAPGAERAAGFTARFPTGAISAKRAR